MPGISSRPPASITRVVEPAEARTSFVVLTAVMRSPLIATASAHGRDPSPGKTRALTIARSGDGDCARAAAAMNTAATGARIVEILTLDIICDEAHGSAVSLPGSQGGIRWTVRRAHEGLAGLCRTTGRTAFGLRSAHAVPSICA